MKYNKSIKVWLFIGLLCVIIQVLVGGVTRLTESGLSITEWEPIKGVFPPMTQSGWEIEFTKYKNTPQYIEVNEGMSLSDFKFIYFWEFIHRQWARVMGLIFFFPFLYFMFKKYIDKTLLNKLFLVIGLAILAASFGWIMVASGLIERPWVNAYKLSIHLCIAFSVYVALLYAFMHTIKESLITTINSRLIGVFRLFLVLLWIQLFLGGIMSGMRIGVVYPTWPDMNGSFIPQIIFNNSAWNVDNFSNYDQNELLPALIHVLHRTFAYLVFGVGLYLSWSMIKTKNKLLVKYGKYLSLVLVLQVLIGILTVINCVGEIPIFWGVLHQAGALALLTVVYLSYYINKHSFQ